MSERIYLDYAAATPLHPEVKKVIEESEKFWANASSLHNEGREARATIDDARFKVAQLLGAETDEIIFTSGATESNVLALRGVLEYEKSRGTTPHIIISKIEHPSVKEIAQQLEKTGVEVGWIGVDRSGLVNAAELSALVRDNTALVSIIYANHELGVVQNISELVKAAKSKNPKTIFHTDAAQGLGWLDINTRDLGIDLLTASSYKLYGPKGVGFLFKKSNIKMQSLFPGFQEWGIRAGTESTSLIAGMGKAFELSKDWPRKQVRELRDYLITEIQKNISGVIVNTHSSLSVPHIAHFSFADIEADSLTIALDRAGVSASPGSACSSGAVQVSHIVEAIGIETEKYPGSLRLSLGLQTTKQQMDKAVQILKQVVRDLRENKK